VSKTILLVEDNADNQAIYRMILEYHEYEVIQAWSGDAGVESARSLRPDLILMDISIPVIDGYEATRILKTDPTTRDIPIVVLTAHALASDREMANEAGCDGFLTKPTEPREVLETIARFLSPGSSGN
jgi:two-component system, cell cycle response regulator DivK